MLYIYIHWVIDADAKGRSNIFQAVCPPFFFSTVDTVQPCYTMQHARHAIKTTPPRSS
jgi:hypothetical protein